MNGNGNKGSFTHFCFLTTYKVRIKVAQDKCKGKQTKE